MGKGRRGNALPGYKGLKNWDAETVKGTCTVRRAGLGVGRPG